jgi:hypothetical protein
MAEENGLIANQYRIDSSRPAPPLAGGLRAFAVTDKKDRTQNLVAVLTRPDFPARPRITLAHAGPAVPYAVLPLDYGSGRDLLGHSGWYVIGEAFPVTPASQKTGPWREKELVACVLLPAAAALLGLQARGLTHRAINPDNLFREGPQAPVTLGPFWAAPPASLQPAVYEPPYSARCLPTGRGDGTIADDVYALGVTLLALAIGRQPLAGLDDEAVLKRKSEQGSYAALTAGVVIPSVIDDLLRSMLAEDPDHRPPPKLLLNPEQARARRVAARPPRRALQSLEIGGQIVWTSRDLAQALGAKPDYGFPLLKSGAVESWLRRTLGDPQLGMAVEEITHKPAEHNQPEDSRRRDMMVMLCVAAIDPLAPLCWRGLALQPDGLGSAMVGAGVDVLSSLEEIVSTEAMVPYIEARPRRPELIPARDSARELRRLLSARGPSGGLRRLIYGLNPMLACASPLLAGHTVVRLNELLQALDTVAATTDLSRPPIDAHIAAFVAARADTSLAGDLVAINSFAGPTERLIVLRLFGRLETRLQPGPLPGLANWLLLSGFATLEDWRSHKRRAALEEALKQAVAEGNIAAMLYLVDDPTARREDMAGAEAAAARVSLLEAALADIEKSSDRRARAARTLGYEFTTGAGLLAVMGAVVSLALH